MKGVVRKNIHKKDRIFRCLIFKNIVIVRIFLESADKCKENREYERKNVLCEILYVLSVCVSGEILEDWKVIHYGPHLNQCRLFFVCLAGIS